MGLRNIKMKPKLILLFLVVSLVPLGIIAFWTSRLASDALRDQSYNQLRSIRAIKKAQIQKFFAEHQGDMNALVETVGTMRQEAFDKLVAVREVKRAAIERYFQNINDQIVTFSEDRMVVEAMDGFREIFREYRNDRGLTPEELEFMRRELITYYNGEFSQEYARQNNGQSPEAEHYFRQLDDDSIALQYEYIRANKHPLGSKHLLDRGADFARYSDLHEKIHPIIRNYLQKFGYYDIFLVDPDSGDIVYSVFKELDFSTSLIDGPYSRTNFGRAFRLANAAGKKDAVVLVDYDRYLPSHEAPASFIASPIFDGDKKIGVAMFQMPIDRLNAVMGERGGGGGGGVRAGRDR